MKRQVKIIALIMSVAVLESPGFSADICASGSKPVTCLEDGDAIVDKPGGCGPSCPEDLEYINFDCTGSTCDPAVRPPDFVGPLRGQLCSNNSRGTENWGTKGFIKCSCDEDVGCITDEEGDGIFFACFCDAPEWRQSDGTYTNIQGYSPSGGAGPDYCFY